MMVRVTEENPGNELSRRGGTEPDRPQPDSPATPTPEQLREFEEFRRFQEFQRWQRDGSASPAPSTGQQQPPAAPGEHAGVQTELAGMREQLSALTESTSRVERATNPPLWKRALRSGWMRWLAGLVVVLVAASLAYNHFFPSDDASGNPAANHPGNQQDVQQRSGGESPKEAVAQIYRDIGSAAESPADAAGYGKNSCLLYFTDQAARKFGHQLGATDCVSAFGKVRVANTAAYQDVSLAALPMPPANTRTVTIDSCKIGVSGGPRLGTFTLTKNDGDKWLITDVAPSSCH